MYMYIKTSIPLTTSVLLVFQRERESEREREGERDIERGRQIEREI